LQIGPNLKYYTSAVAVDDVDRIRAALGYDKIDLYGASYGVTTEQVYLLRHGEHVRRAVLDSGSLLPVRIFENGPRNAQRALDMLFARCTADAACHDAFGDVKAEYAALAARVARKPVPLPEVGAELTPATLALTVDALLPFDKPQVPRFIHLLATGKAVEAAKIVKPYLPTPNAPQLAYMLVIQCSEPWAVRRPAVTERLAAGTFMTPLAAIESANTVAMCKGMVHGYVPAALGKQLHSRVPIMFLQGDEDPADPPSAVAGAKRDLPNSRVVVFPYSGHGQIGMQCAQFLTTRFIAGDDLQRLDTTCADSAAIAPFDTTR
jgi:pimeloyl-ACP methyl ester carboxylesterase